MKVVLLAGLIDPIAAFRARFGGGSSGWLSMQQLITFSFENFSILL